MGGGARGWGALPAAAAGAALLLAGCCLVEGGGREARQGIPEAARTKGPDEVRVMSLNLGDWAMLDRDGDADTLEAKPAEERAALAALMAAVDADVLLVQGVGGTEAWEQLRLDLEAAGVRYRFSEHLALEGEALHQGVLSRLEIVERNSHTEERYTIGPRRFRVKHGIVDVTVDAGGGRKLRLLGVDLKDKSYDDFGQTEMRRNEARLLNNQVRSILGRDLWAKLVVVGSFNDTPDSAAVKDVIEYRYKGQRLLEDVRPVDMQGNAWTGRGENDTYERVDYVLASPAAAKAVVREGTFIPLGSAEAAKACGHRALVVTLKPGD